MRLQARLNDMVLHKLIIGSLCLMILFVAFWTGLPAYAADVGYNDLETAESALPYILYLTRQGVVNGFPDGSFRPWAAVTRGQMVKILVLGLDLELTQQNSVTFPDVSRQHWAYPYIETAAAAGLVNGYPDGTFQPDAVVTRAEQAAMLFSFARYSMVDIPMVEFDDLQAGHWAYAAVAAAVDAGLMGPVEGKMFKPDGASSRAGVSRNTALLTTMLPHNQVGALSARLRPLEGQVTVIGKNGAQQVMSDIDIIQGDKVITGSGARAEIEFDDGSGLRLEPLTEVEIVRGLGSAFITKEGNAGSAINLIEIKLTRGKLVGALATRSKLTSTSPPKTASLIQRIAGNPMLPYMLAATTPVSMNEDFWKQEQPLYLPPGMTKEEWEKLQWWRQPYTKRVRVKVDMPWGVAGIRGTFWQNSVEDGKQSTEVLWGDAEVTAGGKTVPVTTGQHTEVTSAFQAPAAPRKIEAAEAILWQALGQWVVERAVKIEQQAPVKPEANQLLDTPVAPETVQQQTSPLPPPVTVPAGQVPTPPGTQQPVLGQPQQPAPGQPLPTIPVVPVNPLEGLLNKIIEALSDVGVATTDGTLQPTGTPPAGGDAGGSGGGGDTISVAAPTASPQPESYYGSVNISLNSATAGAAIWYTTSGSVLHNGVLRGDAIRYDGPFKLTASSSVSAVAEYQGQFSSVQTFTYTITQLQPPAVAPAGQYFGDSITVTLTATPPGATIYYTLNGGLPQVYNPLVKITLTETTTLLVWTTYQEAVSEQVVAVYTKIAAPTALPLPATYYAGTELNIASITPGAVVYYLAGPVGMPKPVFPDSSAGWTELAPGTTLTVTENQTIWAVAVVHDQVGDGISDVVGFTYTFGQIVAPSASKKGGSYYAPLQVALASQTADPDLEIYYTLDGTAPNNSSNRYTGPLMITTNLILRAIAYVGNVASPEMEQQNYKVFAGEAVISMALLEPPASIATSVVQLTGTVSPVTSLQVLQLVLNGQLVGNIPINNDGSFDYLLFDLGLGDNQIEIRAIDTQNRAGSINKTIERTTNFIYPQAVIQPDTGSISGSAAGFVNLEWLINDQVQGGTVYYPDDDGAYMGLLPRLPGQETAGVPPGELRWAVVDTAQTSELEVYPIQAELDAANQIMGHVPGGMGGELVEVLWYHQRQPAVLENLPLNAGLIPDARMEVALDQEGNFSADLTAAGIPMQSGDVVAVLYPANEPVRSAVAGPVVREPQLLFTNRGITAVLPGGSSQAELQLRGAGNELIAALPVQADNAGYITAAWADLVDTIPLGAKLQLHLDGGALLETPVKPLQVALWWQDAALALAVWGEPQRPVWILAEGAEPFRGNTDAAGELELTISVPQMWSWQPEWQPRVRVVQQLGPGLYRGVQLDLGVAPGLELDLEQSTAQWWAAQGSALKASIPETGQQEMIPGGNTRVALVGNATLRPGLGLQVGADQYGQLAPLHARVAYVTANQEDTVGLLLTGQVDPGQQVLIELGNGSSAAQGLIRTAVPVAADGSFTQSLPAGWQPDWVRVWAMGPGGYRAYRELYPWSLEVNQDAGLIRGYYRRADSSLVISVTPHDAVQTAWEVSAQTRFDGFYKVLVPGGIPTGSRIRLVGDAGVITETVAVLINAYLDLDAGELGSTRLGPPGAVLVKVDDSEDLWSLPGSGGHFSWNFSPILSLPPGEGQLPGAVMATVVPGGHRFQRQAEFLGMQVIINQSRVEALVNTPATTARLRWQRAGQTIWSGQVVLEPAGGGLDKAVFILPGVLRPGDKLELNSNYSVVLPALSVIIDKESGTVNGNIIIGGEPIAGGAVEVAVVTAAKRLKQLLVTGPGGEFTATLPVITGEESLEVTYITATGHRVTLIWEPGEW